jgi:thioredoxin-related protein
MRKVEIRGVVEPNVIARPSIPVSEIQFRTSMLTFNNLLTQANITMLKKLIVFFLLLTSSHAMPITDDPSFKKVYQEKQNSHKIVLMLYTAKSCPQCAYMKQKVFKDTNVKKFLEEHFVIVEKDINRDDLPEEFKYFGIPTMFFIDSKGGKIGEFIGSSRAASFLEELQKIVMRYEK